MKTQLFAVYDSKTKTYMYPQHSLTKGEAVRNLDDAVNGGKGMVANHPEDFTLFHLGSFDDQTGTYDNKQANEAVITALELVKDNVTPLDKAIANKQ